MDKFRRDIHGVFARQQSGLGSTAGASDRLLRQGLATAQVRRHFVPQLAAALATLLVGAAVAYAVVVTRGHLHSQSPITRVTPTARPSASATPISSPTALAQPLNVPSTTPVILYFDPVNPQQVDGVTWDGAQRGRVGDLGGGLALYQNPAGTLYTTFRDIRDRSGQVVAPVVGQTKGLGTWSDDGRHYCQMVSASALPPAGGEPATLRLVTVGGTARNVVQVGAMYDQAASGVAACSIAHDRAVVTEGNSIGLTTKLWVVQLSTGRILRSRSYVNSAAHVSVSRDGQYVAEPSQNGSTTIYGPTGAVAGHVSGPVQGFSWDDNLVVVGQYGQTASVVRWSDDKVLWTAPAGTMYSDSLPQSGGSSIAVEVQTPGHPQTGGYPIVDVYVVSPDGTAVKVLENVSL